MKRIFIGIIIIFIIFFPLGLVTHRNWDKIQESFVKTRFTARKDLSPQYSAETKTPGLMVAVTNTAFLEYIAATMKIYEQNAIADPQGYFGALTNSQRFTVSRLKFELVPTLDRYLVGLGGSTDFAGRGVYAIEGDELVVRVSINEEELEKGKDIGQFAVEDMFLDTALQVLIYATGKPGVPVSPVELMKM
jgi:hypothetical protein